MLMFFLAFKQSYSIYRFKRDSVLPDWIYSSEFYSITRTQDELSVVAVNNDSVSDDVSSSKNWRLLKVIGPLNLSLTGIIADISDILKEASIPVFTISTFDTDYFLVQHKDMGNAIKALRDNGHRVSVEE